MQLHSVTPLIYRGLGFLKNHRRGDQDFLVKMGWGGGGGVDYRVEGGMGQHCFSLIIFGFCRNVMDLHTASL